MSGRVPGCPPRASRPSQSSVPRVTSCLPPRITVVPRCAVGYGEEFSPRALVVVLVVLLHEWPSARCRAGARELSAQRSRWDRKPDGCESPPRSSREEFPPFLRDALQQSPGVESPYVRKWPDCLRVLVFVFEHNAADSVHWKDGGQLGRFTFRPRQR